MDTTLGRRISSRASGTARLLVAAVLLCSIGPWASGYGSSAEAVTVPLPLGTVTVSPTVLSACQSTGACDQFTSICPSVHDPASGYLQIGAPGGAPRGVVMLFSGVGGTAWWGDTTGATAFLTALQKSGYETVQVRFTNSWLAAAPGERAGPASLACRTSSLVQWTYTNLYQKLRIPAHPVGVCGFCLTGNSGGAAAITYAISRYGLSSIVDAAIPSSGPPLASIEKGCTMLQADSAYWYEGWARALIDGAYGYAGAGPCATNSTSFATRWEADGVNDGGQYSLPTTRVHFIFGGADTSEAVAHGKDYLRLLTDSGSPLVSSETVPGMPHDISDSTAGLAALTAAITWTPPSVTPVPSPRASPTATPRVLPTSTPLPRATPSPSATATRSTPTPTPRPTRTPTRVFESPR